MLCPNDSLLFRSLLSDDRRSDYRSSIGLELYWLVRTKCRQYNKCTCTTSTLSCTSPCKRISNKRILSSTHMVSYLCWKQWRCRSNRIHYSLGRWCRSWINYSNSCNHFKCKHTFLHTNNWFNSSRCVSLHHPGSKCSWNWSLIICTRRHNSCCT